MRGLLTQENKRPMSTRVYPQRTHGRKPSDPSNDVGFRGRRHT